MKKRENIKSNSCRNRSYVLASIALLLTLALFGCSTLQLNSKIRSREVVVDGKNTEWMGVMSYIEDDQISVGIVNDKDYIYVCMISENQFLRNQMMMQGFMVWFDPAGGKKKRFGIRFPRGWQSEMRERVLEGRERSTEPRERGQDPKRRQELFEKALAELDILGPEKDDYIRLPVREAKGIEVKLNASIGIIIYELKVPILCSEQHPYAVGVKVGDTIGIGMEIPRFNMSGMRRRLGGGMPGGGGRGGMPGGMGGRGGMDGGMGMRGGMGPRMPQGLKVWMKVQLASSSH